MHNYAYIPYISYICYISLYIPSKIPLKIAKKKCLYIDHFLIPGCVVIPPRIGGFVPENRGRAKIGVHGGGPRENAPFFPIV